MHTLLITRPQPQADSWAKALQTQGIAAQALPLLQINFPAASAALAQAWRGLAAYRAVMFVSPAAVEGFFRGRPTDALAWPAATLAATPGPGTAALLQDHLQRLRGVHPLLHEPPKSPEAPEPAMSDVKGRPGDANTSPGPNDIQIICPGPTDETFDSQSLWRHLCHMPWASQHVLIVHGADETVGAARQWLSDQWQALGATVQAIDSYGRGSAIWTPAERQLAQQACLHPRSFAWLLSSSQGLSALHEQLLPAAQLNNCQFSHWQALCTHPRIAESARQRGWGHIQTCQPTLEAVARARRLDP